jgi:hypothetical protein
VRDVGFSLGEGYGVDCSVAGEGEETPAGDCCGAPVGEGE